MVTVDDDVNTTRWLPLTMTLIQPGQVVTVDDDVNTTRWLPLTMTLIQPGGNR